MQIQHEDNVLTIDGNRHVLSHRILDAKTGDHLIYVVFDYMAYPADQPALNLVALDFDANLIWTVDDNPIQTPAAGYVGINSVAPLEVYNFAGFVCIIDAGTGRLLESQFTK